MENIIKDCKLKFDQIQKRDDTIAEYAKEDGLDDLIDSMQKEKSKFTSIIAQVYILILYTFI